MPRKVTVRILLMLLPMVVVVSSIVPNLIVLSRAGELLTGEEVAERQVSSGGIYGTGIHDNTMHYKMALLRLKKAKVIAWGSSRSLQFRENFFSDSFLNIGRTVGSLQDAAYLLPKVLQNDEIKVVLLPVDYWWLTTTWEGGKPADKWASEKMGIEAVIKMAFAPLQWLKDGKITWSTYVQMFEDGITNPDHEMPAYGINAQLRSNGFFPDGSYFYGGLVMGREPSWDYKFQETRRRIDLGLPKFKHFASISEEAISRLDEIVAAFQRKGIKVIVLLPPLAPSVIDYMNERNPKFAYIDDIHAAVSKVSADYVFDFHDARDLGASDCEYIDGFHGGEIVYARLAAYMSEHVDDDLKTIFDTERLKDVVSNYKNLTTTAVNANESQESDFLGFGCDKLPQLKQPINNLSQPNA